MPPAPAPAFRPILGRNLPEEIAVAVTYNASTQAVMMATPQDLEDFAYGFSLTEGIATREEITGVEVADVPRGIDLRIWLKPQAGLRLAERRRMMTGPVGCGLCGIDSLEQALREMPAVTADLRLTRAEVEAATGTLRNHQPLHDATRAAHAAGFWQPEGGYLAVREDVGRHNALDKLAGAVAGRCDGAVVMTSRVSVDLVQKIAAMNVPVLIAVSAPTAQAVELANRLNITLVGLARGASFECFTHPHRIT
ncbi:formate dehydrogenase accessory sulfurtransferase FdhD [Falsirhodobacter sp. 20TX0035]|uniref:formate dehydrogenase accessory sulfurtransferase FdhD n=1 Tax=Falsirhodobacter sp. 20TX0035 TaxID=3022019 RepID=UPI00232C0204|nr:formate dehydrogenase accessory sulfurtransferase FdhD [Falsirhodobacter sp. 20TX0035]MDB6453018.1 formate dehydrogenase accessory sulfurtransferase FdhD [Falsirhodobacter sp. 20TX0035]